MLLIKITTAVVYCEKMTIQQQPILYSEIYHLCIEPLSWQHFDALKQLSCQYGLQGIIYNSVPYIDQLNAYFELAFEQQKQGIRMPFAVIDTQRNSVMGAASYCDMQSNIPRLEIGYTWYGTQFQKTYVNRVSKYLLLHHAFESMQVQAVSLKTDNLNINSQRAIQALGAKLDGILRCHMLRKDGQTVRDRYFFSILQSEWTVVKANLESKLMHYAQQAHFEI